MNGRESGNSAANINSMSGVFDTGLYTRYKVIWGAVVAGAIVSLLSATLLNILGLGLGLFVFNLKGDSVLLTFGIGAVSWLFLSGILSSWVCGWFAGVFSNTYCRFERGCHGILAWSIALIMTIILATAGAGTVVGGAVGLLEHSPAQVKSKMSAQIPANLPQYINNVESGNSSSENSISSDTKDAINTAGVSSLIIFAVLLLSGLASIFGAAFCSVTNLKHNHKQS
ncbi:MAG: hypothetical protein K0R14_2156 [Burkholderiales bacterium]|jgi:hypothetical protein|nr:hypothetical protein [Burkholderiales bacterium]